jgi:hypothetical protein
MSANVSHVDNPEDSNMRFLDFRARDASFSSVHGDEHNDGILIPIAVILFS